MFHCTGTSETLKGTGETDSSAPSSPVFPPRASSRVDRWNQGPLPDSIQGTWREDGVGAGENAAPPRLKQTFSPEEASTGEWKASSDARLDKKATTAEAKVNRRWAVETVWNPWALLPCPALLHLPLTAQFKLIS